ncbi:MAG: AAA-like domain-containing protein [Chloroflexi bacterium]|nr:AAA-like domain-containing protein [Chloroflexota bacterium]
MLTHCEPPARIGMLTYADFTNPETRATQVPRLLRAVGVDATATNAVNTSPRKRIFISYKRDSDPDETVARQVFEALQARHYVFIDRAMRVGARWGDMIEAELRRADYLIVFLSEHSIHSEMVKGEIETAHQLAREQGGHPIILPVRVAYREPFKYPLSTYLDHINWAFWSGPADTPHVIAQLEDAIAGVELRPAAPSAIQFGPPSRLPAPPPFAQPIQLEMPQGTMDAESKFYIERSSDLLALSAIEKQGGTLTIKGPRQMGKSSLLIRTINHARSLGKQVALLDFQLFDKAALTDADRFFHQFCTWLTDELDLDDRVAEHWGAGKDLSNPQRCTRYMSRYLLRALSGPLVLAMDEVETMFDTDFRSDFFGMLRGWHNKRATQLIWKQLDLALVTSTEPYQLIDNLNQSPFNVGEVIDLKDFTAEQVAQLNRRHGSPLRPQHEQQLMLLLSGHPYLVRRALYLIAGQYLSATELFAGAADDRGPFGDHLRYHLFRMRDKPELVRGLLQIIHQHRCQDESVFFRLHGAGLVHRVGKIAMPRCQLYATYFQEHLHG